MMTFATRRAKPRPERPGNSNGLTTSEVVNPLKFGRRETVT